MNELALIDDSAELRRATAAVATAEIVALDTEFVRERTYYPQLCLIQVATPEMLACIDCLAPLDFDPFLQTLLDPARSWVLHSARQDLEVIWNRTHALPATLIDTQIAGALIGLAPQASLQKMLEATLGISLEKDQTRAEWNRRPLGDAALRYALDDVRHLLDAWQVLQERLLRLDRWEWLLEDCARLLRMNPEATAQSIYDRTRGVGALDSAQQGAALALIEWRELRAKALDRPRRWILSDEQLLRIARGQPVNSDALESIPDLPRRLISRHGNELLDAIKRARSRSGAAVAGRHRATEKPDKGRVQAAQAEIRRRAEELGIAPEILATRRDATALACGRPPEHIANGWRATVLRDLL